MEYHAIGDTGVTVSAVGFGCAPLGNLYGTVEEGEAQRAVQAAIDAGITLFDTSPYYGLTLSEQVLGRALQGRRHQITLSSKAGRVSLSDFDFSAAAMRRSVEASLKRLNTDYLDILFAHDIEFGDPRIVLGETNEALQAMKRDGLCRAVGMSALPLHVLTRAIASCPLDVVITYCHGTLNDDAMLTDLLPVAQAHNISVINASPLSMGLLAESGPPPWHPATEEIKAGARRALEAAAAHGFSISRTALSWAFRLPGVVSTLIGARSLGELRSSLDAYSTPPDPRAMALLQDRLEPIHNRTWPSSDEAAWAIG